MEGAAARWATKQRPDLREGAAFFVMACIALDVPLRYCTGSLGANIRDFVFLCIGLAALVQARGQNGVTVIVLFAALAFHTAVGLFVMGFNGPGIDQAAFGLKILLPFLAGLCLPDKLFGRGRTVVATYMVILVVTICGLLLDWAGALAGMNSSIQGEIGSKQYGYATIWAGGNLVRLAGFARSFASASTILCASLLIVITALSRPRFKLLLIAISLYPLWLTNSKATAVAGILLLPLQMLGAPTALRVHKWLIAILIALNVALPVLSSGLYYHFPISGNELTYSMVDRLMNTWPNAWTLFHRTGFWLFGRGIGGIGAPQMVYAPINFNAGDSLFVYMFAYFGILALPYLGIIGLCVFRENAKASVEASQAASILTFTLFEGLTTGVFEGAFTFFVVGGAVGFFYRNAASGSRSTHPAPASRAPQATKAVLESVPNRWMRQLIPCNAAAGGTGPVGRTHAKDAYM